MLSSDPASRAYGHLCDLSPRDSRTFDLHRQDRTSITDDTNKTIVLEQTITLSGVVRDSLGNGVPHQQVQFGDDSVITDSTGHYSLSTTPGTKTLTITNTPVHQNDYSLNVPGQYLIYLENHAITQSTSNLDLTIPAKKVTFHIQDALNNPVDGVMIKAYHADNYVNDGGLSIGGGITNASAAYSDYTSDVSPKTDGSGDVVEWLLPNNNTFSYNFTATPPNGGIYASFALDNVSVTDNQKEVISLQYAQITTTIIKDTITQMYTSGSITKLGSSLNDKLTLAQASIQAGEYPQAKDTLRALINQIQAQIDIHITAAAAAILIDQINTLINSLP